MFVEIDVYKGISVYWETTTGVISVSYGGVTFESKIQQDVWEWMYTQVGKPGEDPPSGDSFETVYHSTYRGFEISKYTLSGMYAFTTDMVWAKNTIQQCYDTIDAFLFVGPLEPIDLNGGDDNGDDEDPILSIIPIDVIVTAAPWIIQEIILLGLKALTVSEILEMITGQEFYSLDDVVQWIANVLRGGNGGNGVGAGDDPGTQKKGVTRSGWLVKVIDDYDYGKKTSKKVWYKPYEDKSRTTTGSVMNFSEKCAYFQGKRVQAYDSRSAKYNAYKRGYGHGANDQFQAQLLMGHTRPCAPQLFYARGRRGSMRRY